MIYMDARESKKRQKLAKEILTEVEVTFLATADFIFNDVGVEWKEWEDFVKSENEGRLLNQVKHMLANFNQCYIIVVAPDRKVYNNPRTKSMPGSRFRSLIIQYGNMGCTLVPVASDPEGMRAMKSICKYAGTERVIDNGLKRIAPRTDDKYVDMLCVCDGVGPEIARRILKVFKAWELWEVSEKDLRHSVDGVGPTIAKEIKKVFHK